MQTLDRFSPPKAGELKQVSLPPYGHITLSNGTPVYFLNCGNAEVVQVQMVFKGGSAFQRKVGQANYTGRMMQEGTKRFTSLQLAQNLDQYGAWIGHESGENGYSLQLTTLSSRLEETLPLLEEVCRYPTFPEEEFVKMKTRNLQKLQVSGQKTSYQARRHFGHRLYGKDHPYGIHLGEPELNALELEDLREYHSYFLRPSNAFFIVTGQFDQDKTIKLLEDKFGGGEAYEPINDISKVLSATLSSEIGRRHISIDGMQSTIRLGHLGIMREHDDYYSMQVVNTIFGGYFGSRLMKNIREEKGYTYGIYSAWVSYKYSGYLVVQGDVGNEYVEDTISEIKKEMRRMMTEPMPKEELDLVKNYLLGKSISQRETPFQLGDVIRFSVITGIPFEELDRKFEIIQQIQVEDVMRLAQEYFRPDQMLEVVAGAKA